VEEAVLVYAEVLQREPGFVLALAQASCYFDFAPYPYPLVVENFHLMAGELQEAL
jgi:hypothetical protein